MYVLVLTWIILLWTNKISFEKLGENVEPVELEEAALRSPVIQQIVVIGQVEFCSFAFKPLVLDQSLTFREIFTF